MHRLSLVRLIRAAKVEVTLLKARWRGLGKEVELRRNLKPACQGRHLETPLHIISSGMLER